jgi:signal transduction histidine kinase
VVPSLGGDLAHQRSWGHRGTRGNCGAAVRSAGGFATGDHRPATALLDDLGLRAAITSVAANLGDIDVAVVVRVTDCDLAPHVETALFRIVQETLQNVVKHADASRVEVTLANDGEGVTLTVTDDGVGYDPATASGPTSFGLAGIHERAGLLRATLMVRSAPGSGTTVAVRLPGAASSTGA